MEIIMQITSNKSIIPFISEPAVELLEPHFRINVGTVNKRTLIVAICIFATLSVARATMNSAITASITIPLIAITVTVVAVATFFIEQVRALRKLEAVISCAINLCTKSTSPDQQASICLQALAIPDMKNLIKIFPHLKVKINELLSSEMLFEVFAAMPFDDFKDLCTKYKAFKNLWTDLGIKYCAVDFIVDMDKKIQTLYTSSDNTLSDPALVMFVRLSALAIIFTDVDFTDVDFTDVDEEDSVQDENSVDGAESSDEEDSVQDENSVDGAESSDEEDSVGKRATEHVRSVSKHGKSWRQAINTISKNKYKSILTNGSNVDFTDVDEEDSVQDENSVDGAESSDEEDSVQDENSVDGAESSDEEDSVGKRATEHVRSVSKHGKSWRQAINTILKISTKAS